MTSSPSYSHTLSLHDALPISFAGSCDRYGRKIRDETRSWRVNQVSRIIGMSRRRASEGHLGLGRQLVEMVMLRTLHGVGPGYYHTAGFWRRGLSWREKTSQLGARAYQRRIMKLNPAAYHKLSGNKIAEKALLNLFDIPTPRFLGRLEARAGRDSAGRPLRDASDLEQIVNRLHAERLEIGRPEGPEGFGGKGVHI